MTLREIWQKITNNGLDDRLQGREVIKMRLLNQLVFTALVATTILTISYFLYGETKARMLFQLLSTTIEISGFICISIRKYEFAKAIPVFLFPTTLTIETIYYGGNMGENSIFTLFGFIAIMIYEDRRYLQILSVSYISFLYIFSQFYIIHYNVVSDVIDNPYDELIMFLMMILGISFILILSLNELKKQEQEKQELIDHLKQANYELRTFNYIASHDIKEPIRNIGGHAGLIFRKLPVDLKESLGEYFDTIKRSTSQLYNLIEDFANYTTMSKNETIETEEVDLRKLTSTVVDNLQETIKKYNGQVELLELPTIQSSNSLLFTTLKNLIENGLKYNKSIEPTVKVNYNKTATHHEITVSDNGIGIDQQYHEKIFEMFKRLHNRGAYEGSGIGLAIVKLSVDKLDGTIELDSKEGQGSRFLVSLPI